MNLIKIKLPEKLDGDLPLLDLAFDEVARSQRIDMSLSWSEGQKQYDGIVRATMDRFKELKQLKS